MVLGVPFVVPRPAVPQPRESTLTIRLSGDEGASLTQPAYVAVEAEGNPPTLGEVTDATGQHSAKVASTPGKCTGEPRTVGVPPGSGTPWCLRFTGVDPGVTLTGTVSASDPPAGSEFTTLGLTVTRRDAFWPLPLLTLLAGLVVGALACVVPVALRGNVTQVRLARLLERNRRAKSEDQIVGLDDWVQARFQEGKTIEQLLDPVGRAVQYGPERARFARAKLSEALEKSARPADLPFYANARAEQAKADNQVSDFLADDLAIRSRHPAADWTDAVATVDGHLLSLQGQEWEVEHRIAEKCRERAEETLRDAKARVETAANPEDVGNLAEPMRELVVRIRKIREQPGCMKELKPGTKPLAASAPAGPVEAPALDLSGNWLRANSRRAIAVGVVIGIAIVAYAGVSLYFNVYDPNPTFHAFGADYLALFAAALVSAAAGAVIELLSYWKPKLAAGG